MKLTGSTKKKITKDKNGENGPSLKITEEILVHCNLVNNTYQHNPLVFNTFKPNKSFPQLLEISPSNFCFLKTFNSEFSFIEV